jgi:lipopolysaccharide transport system ATP-binding protein
MKPILEVQQLSKKYRIRHEAGGYLSLRERMQDVFRLKKNTIEDFWALNDVSFSVQPGESIGIIGRNGAGKSTLLKILSKITPPTKGKIISRGRIASLLEVGTGFHPELTGRENIFFNGSLLGMKKREIQSHFDEIIDFSGTEQFLDTPLKHYSSGMQLRLAFAVAAFLEPEILIIDEVLAVGDAEFQKKCIGKMEDVTQSGRTILFVSHNMGAVQNLCQRGILLEDGKVVANGSSGEVIKSYQSLHSNYQTTSWQKKKIGKEPIFFSKIDVELAGEQPELKLQIKSVVKSQFNHNKAFVAFDISNSNGIAIFQVIPETTPFIECKFSEQVIVTEVALPPLIPDQYKVSAWIGSHNTETFCWDKFVVGFEIDKSPIQGRNLPHSHHNGFLIPKSKLLND